MTMTDGAAPLQLRHPVRRTGALERAEALAELTGFPQRRFPSVHVTGTNGKTTTTRMIAALLTAHGSRTGAFTSPHLQDVSERVRIDGRPICEPDLAARLAEVDAHRGQVTRTCGEPPAFFETMAILACLHFAASPVDAAVFEVGIGGRRDATNILHAPVAVIGEVGLDHPELGATRADVAWHKAGIIAPGGVAVVGPQQADAADMIESTAAACGARLWRYGVEIGIRDLRCDAEGQSFTVTLPDDRVDVRIGLQDPRHAVNAALALAAARAHLGELTPAAVREAFDGFAAPGRGELLRRTADRTYWLDGAHNPAAVAGLADRMLGSIGTKATVVLGAMSDKDLDGIAQTLAPVTRYAIAVPAGTSRGADPRVTAEVIRRHGIECDTAADVAAGIKLARDSSVPGEPIVVCGSLYVVGAARTELGLDVE